MAIVPTPLPRVSQLHGQIFRVVWQPWGCWDLCESHSWAVVGPTVTGTEALPFTGTHRDAINDLFRNPTSSPTEQYRVLQSPEGGFVWQCRCPGEEAFVSFHEDVHYRVETNDDGVCGLGNACVHRWKRLDDSDAFYGLGESTGPLNRSRRRFRLRPVDCMGYDAETADPLYKHLPFVVVRRRISAESVVFFAYFYDTLHECVFDIGAEVNNYYGPYATFATRSTSMDYYFIVGRSFQEVLSHFSNSVVGRIPQQPSWSFGYLGSAMGYTDDDHPMEALQTFLTLCRVMKIPCTGFHLSSGYTMSDADGKRYVFEWNQSRYPSNPHHVVSMFEAAGVKLIANIKPALLTTHPLYASCAEKQLFLADSTGTPTLSKFWGGDASYLNFFLERAREFWSERVKNTLLFHGVSSMWNDNNECTEARGVVAHETGMRPVAGLRPLLPLLMTWTSAKAQVEFSTSPEVPFVLTRSGMYGSHRVASTWTGDNYTSWKTLKFNIPMGLNMAMSGWSNTGHDIGGFAGPQPTQELMFRWVQVGVCLPRFSIHSWKPECCENSCWMFEKAPPEELILLPEAQWLPITRALRDLVQFRHTIIPWLEQLSRFVASSGEPFIAPLIYHHPTEDDFVNEFTMFYLGPDALVVPVLEEGARSIRIANFPCGEWYSWDGADHLDVTKSGLERTVSTPIWHEDGTPTPLPIIFVRAGSVIPVCSHENESQITLKCFPSKRSMHPVQSLLSSVTLPSALQHALELAPENASKYFECVVHK